MHNWNQNFCRFSKTSRVFTALLCALCLGLSALPVNAQSQNSGVSEFKMRLHEQLANSNRSQQTVETTAIAKPPSAPAIETKKENTTNLSGQKKIALEGSWLVDIMIVGGELDGTVLKSLQAYTTDGRAFITAQGDTINPVFSPQLGSWEYQGEGTFAVTLLS